MHILKRLLVEVTRDDHTIAGLFSSKQDFVWISFPLEIMLASIYTLTKLAPFSIFADIVNFGSMALVMQQDVVTMISKGVCSVSVYNSLKTLPFAIGVAIYAYEGIALVIPLESSMLEREKFGKVLGLAMVSITALYITFGLFGYLAFGEETLDIVTMNLEPGLKTTLVKLGLCVGLLFTFAVMMFPVHQVMEQRLVRGKPNTLLRIVVVLMATLCATAVPRFGDFLSLVGNSVCCALAFVVPSCFHMKAHRDDISKSMLCIDYIIMIFGTAYGVWGTILAWSNISPAN
ncbi:hypothetical protein KP509_03G069200 [Ceratopteris richardii]|nr:hypothetical protein KP509_03G069200 [Ceratopteris richardii]